MSRRRSPDGSDADSGINRTEAALWILLPALFAAVGGFATGRWTEVAVAFGVYLAFVGLGLVIAGVESAVDWVSELLDR